MIVPTIPHDTIEEINGATYVRTNVKIDKESDVFWEIVWEEKEHFIKRVRREESEKMKTVISSQKDRIAYLEKENGDLAKLNKEIFMWLIISCTIIIVLAGFVSI
ncbi:hypothetical protein CIL05_07815 [Virgibacillus profundi]|uniref:Uncharacterized protein n=1 Tax=Virgibacillus profundi TaxID=2024555 RepID=A0A2A2IF38_9BACI|nr:hypothetical protein [Virgibacillus profundi]PAV30369.1 hypothetical protein CIL05_07815 [Virgibacillus profundi]PXY54541.1 hypothetical protein CIT14_07900 [Virgibacillus profundi]